MGSLQVRHTGTIGICFILRQVAMLKQLYVFAHMPLGKTIAVLSAVSIVLSNVVGVLFLREVLPPVGYAGVMLAILAIVILAFK